MKRLFTNINVIACGVSDNEYYKNIVEELKKCSWEKLSDNKFLCVSVDWLTFFEMTAIDYRYFEEKNIAFRYEIFFEKLPDGQFEYEVNFYEKEERQYSDYLIVENDDLELFKAESEEDNDGLGLFHDTLHNALQNNSNVDIIEYLKENFTDLWNSIVEDVADNTTVDDIKNYNCYLYDRIKDDILDGLDADDLADDLKDDVGREWAENNTDELKDIWLDNANSQEMRDMVCDIVHDYL